MKKDGKKEIRRITFLIIALIILVIISIALDSVVGAFNMLVPMKQGIEGGGVIDTTPPKIISPINVIVNKNSPTDIGAKITFKTNEPATTKIYYTLYKGFLFDLIYMNYTTGFVYNFVPEDFEIKVLAVLYNKSAVIEISFPTSSEIKIVEPGKKYTIIDKYLEFYVDETGYTSYYDVNNTPFVNIFIGPYRVTGHSIFDNPNIEITTPKASNDHTIYIRGLEPNKIYYFFIKYCDIIGNCAQTDIQSFSTY